LPSVDGFRHLLSNFGGTNAATRHLPDGELFRERSGFDGVPGYENADRRAQQEARRAKGKEVKNHVKGRTNH